MFRRQKILLGLLETFDGELTRTSLQKLLFLYCEQNADPVYEFVPYKFGCFSFQAAADQRKLVANGLLADGDRWCLTRKTGVVDSLSFAERDAFWRLKKRFGQMPQRDLVRHVYNAYPYFATRSEIAQDYLSDEEMKAVRRAAPKADTAMASICSIGYEGLTLEGYLNRLVRHGVCLVCDVRKNPLSRKFGFSKTALNGALDHMGIEYRHFPELGIVSDKRQSLDSQADYDRLFEEYEQTTLNDGDSAVTEIADLLNEKKHVALLCYEKLTVQCHRTRVAKAVLARYGDVCQVYTE